MKLRHIVCAVVVVAMGATLLYSASARGQREEIATPEYLSSVRTAKKPNPCASLDKQTKQCIRRISKNQAKKQIEKMDSGVALYKNSGVAAMNCKEISDQYICISPEYSYNTIGSLSEWESGSPEAFALECDKGPNDVRLAFYGLRMPYGIIGEPDKRVYIHFLQADSEAEFKEKMAEYSLTKDVIKIIYCIDVGSELKLIGQ